MLGANTDVYQPIEKQYQVTRALLEVMRAYNQPVNLITKKYIGAEGFGYFK